MSGFPRRIFEPKNTGDIVFTVEADTSENNSKSHGNATNCSDYKKMLSSLAKLDDTKSPGIKKLVLKDYLKKKIEDKKVLNFKKAKDLLEIDSEMAFGTEEEIMSESELSEEKNSEKASDSTDEEEIVEADKLNDFCTDSLDVSKFSDIVNNDEENIGYVKRKTRKVHILEDDSSNESCVDNDRSHGGKHSLAKATDLNCKSKPQEDVQINEFIINHRENNSEVDSQIPTQVSFFSPEASKASKCTNKDYFQDCSTKELSEDIYDFAEPLDKGIMPSIPSYQHGGGFHQQEGVNLDFNEIVKSELTQKHNMYSISKHSDSRVQDFFDIEADVSGDDDDVADEDEANSDEGDNELDLEDDYELSSAVELRNEISNMYTKQMCDDDDELLKQTQEKFLEDGELNTDSSQRPRKFTWLNSDASDAIYKDTDNSSDSESDDSLNETWSSMNRKKAKWLQEKAEMDLSEELCFDYKASKKPHLKIKIIGKTELSKGRRESPDHLSYKRPRGSYLCRNEYSDVLKRLKTSEDICNRSRTAKYFTKSYIK